MSVCPVCRDSGRVTKAVPQDVSILLYGDRGGHVVEEPCPKCGRKP